LGRGEEAVGSSTRPHTKGKGGVTIGVVDLDLLNQDPDPDPGFFDDQKLKEKKIQLEFFKIAI
jgi:hypothetical protein